MLLGGAAFYFYSRGHTPAPVTASILASPQPLPPPPPPSTSADAAPVQEVALVIFPLDAHVYVGQTDLGPMPVSVKVREGQPVKVSVIREGYWTRKLTLDGTKKRVVVGLVKRDDSKAPPPDQEAQEEPDVSKALPTAQDAQEGQEGKEVQDRKEVQDGKEGKEPRDETKAPPSTPESPRELPIALPPAPDATPPP